MYLFHLWMSNDQTCIFVQHLWLPDIKVRLHEAAHAHFSRLLPARKLFQHVTPL